MQYLCNISRKTQRMKLIFLLADKHQIFLQIDTITFGGVARHAQITQYNKFAICNILWKNWVTKLIFCMQIIMKVSYKLLLWFLIGMVKHSQSYQNSKFPMSLQYRIKNGKVDFLLAEKHQRFLQTDTIILGLCGQACPN